MAEERLKLAVFVDFDNIQIGVKDTLGKEFDVALVLEALKERGEVVSKIAYGDWHRAGDQSRQMAQHAVQLVQRNVTPRGDKNGADINLALDALEMAFTRHHINAFVIVGGDSDFMTLVEKLKQYDKRVFVVGGRAFTSNILQRNCHEFLAYENLLKSAASGDGSRAPRGRRRPSAEVRSLTIAWPNVRRALKILAEREVAPQIGLLKSTILQLDPTFSERDYGAGSFLEFTQKMAHAGLVRLRKNDQGYLVEPADSEGAGMPEAAEAEVRLDTSEADGGVEAQHLRQAGADAATLPTEATKAGAGSLETKELLKQALGAAREKLPNRPLYLRQVRQALRAVDKSVTEGSYGPRVVLDLLHQAQREGWVKLQRDRKGVLRVFPVPPTPSSPPAPFEPAVEETFATVVPAEFPPTSQPETAAETSFETSETPAVEATPAEVPTTEGSAAGEPSGEVKARKHRAIGTQRKGGRRRVSTRRKPKETAEE